jgi:hypothetical protein
MQLTDLHYVTYTPGSRYVLNRYQRGLVRKQVWRRKRHTWKPVTMGPLRWIIQAPQKSTDCREPAATSWTRESRNDRPLQKHTVAPERAISSHMSGDLVNCLSLSVQQWPNLPQKFDLCEQQNFSSTCYLFSG